MLEQYQPNADLCACPQGHRGLWPHPAQHREKQDAHRRDDDMGVGPAMLLEGATDTCALEVCMDQALAPAPLPGQAVVTDASAATYRPLP